MSRFGCSKSEPALDHPLCHAMWAAACVLDVVAKALTVATNFLMFCSTGSVNGVAFMVSASGFECAVGVGRYTLSQ